MGIGSIMLATALLLLVGLYVLRPILIPQQKYQPPPTAYTTLLAEKDALLELVRAVDFDYETGKIEEADYQRERYHLVQSAAEKLRQLDELPQDAKTDDVSAQIEAAIAALRRGTPCPNCGVNVPSGNKFCGQCGEAA